MSLFYDTLYTCVSMILIVVGKVWLRADKYLVTLRIWSRPCLGYAMTQPIFISFGESLVQGLDRCWSAKNKPNVLSFVFLKETWRHHGGSEDSEDRVRSSSSRLQSRCFPGSDWSIWTRLLYMSLHHIIQWKQLIILYIYTSHYKINTLYYIILHHITSNYSYYIDLINVVQSNHYIHFYTWWCDGFDRSCISGGLKKSRQIPDVGTCNSRQTTRHVEN